MCQEYLLTVAQKIVFPLYLLHIHEFRRVAPSTWILLNPCR